MHIAHSGGKSPPVIGGKVVNQLATILCQTAAVSRTGLHLNDQLCALVTWKHCNVHLLARRGGVISVQNRVELRMTHIPGLRKRGESVVSVNESMIVVNNNRSMI